MLVEISKKDIVDITAVLIGCRQGVEYLDAMGRSNLGDSISDSAESVLLLVNGMMDRWDELDEG